MNRKSEGMTYGYLLAIYFEDYYRHSYLSESTGFAIAAFMAW